MRILRAVFAIRSPNDESSSERVLAVGHTHVSWRVGRGGGALRKRRDVRSFPPFYALLDNVRSVFNVGSIFRSADGVGLGHLFLCGITPTPEHRKLAKTALGAETEVAWSYCTNGLDQVSKLKSAGCEILALEARPDAISLFQHEIRIGAGTHLCGRGQ